MEYEKIFGNISRKHSRIIYKAMKGDQRSQERLEKILGLYGLGGDEKWMNGD